ERTPVGPRVLEVVLAARRVREHTVEVDDDGRAGLDLARAPRPMFGLDVQSSAGCDVRYFALIPSTTVGSASVVTSPGAWSSATSRRSRRMILPDRVFGSSSVKSTDFGLAIGPMSWATWSRNSSTSASPGSTPPRNVTNAAIA